MSWWDVGGGGDDVIGDRPADLLARALTEVVRRRSARQQPRPPLPEILGAFAAGVAQAPDLVEQATALNGGQVVAKLSSGAPVAAEESSAAEDVAAFSNALRAVAAEYRQRWGRNPRLRELLELLHFVLGPEWPDESTQERILLITVKPRPQPGGAEAGPS